MGERLETGRILLIVEDTTGSKPPPPTKMPSSSAHDGRPCSRGVVEAFDGDGEDASFVSGMDA